jgi:hypothetical protein
MESLCFKFLIFNKKMKLYPIETGNFKLDGGAMFGLYPKQFGVEPILPMLII